MLEEAGYLARTWVSATATGRKALAAEVAALRELIEGLEGARQKAAPPAGGAVRISGEAAS